MVTQPAMSVVTRLYAFGSNGSGQLGVGHSEDLSKPEVCIFSSGEDDHCSSTQITTNLRDRIVKIVAGGNHTLVLTESGTVYAAGDNSSGRYDPSRAFESSNRFLLVEKASQLGNVSDIAAMWDISFLVVDNSKVYAFGVSNERPHSTQQSDSETATDCMPIFDVDIHASAEGSCSIVAITASMQHVLVLLSNGVVFGWGVCRKGQLGDLPNGVGAVATKPVRVKLPFMVAEVVTGRDYTFLRSTDGNSMVLGERKHFVQTYGFRGDGRGSLQSGWSAVFSLEDGIICGMGRGNRGQLPPKGLPTLKAFAAGSEHVIALTQDDTVLAWGWGEHGNCGHPLDERGNVSGRYNIIEGKLDVQEKFSGLGAGCATSFFWTQLPINV